MRETLLILGASRYQLPAIETARRLGLRVVTADNVPANPGHALADLACEVDTTDREAILALARRERVAGVLASCTDVAVPTAALVSRELGLSGPPLEAAEICCDKAAFRAWMRREGFRTPEWHLVGPSTAWDESAWGGRAWMLKPTRSSGSKGVRQVTGEADYRAGLPPAIGASLSGEAVLEAYLEGRHGTAEGLIRGGRVVFHVLTRRLTAPPPYGATRGHVWPGGWSAEEEACVMELLGKAAARMGLEDCLFDADFIVEGGRVWLLEFSPRQGGNSLNRLLEASHGISLVEWGVQLAVGGPLRPVLRQERRAAVVRILGVDRPGRLRYREDVVTRLNKEPWVVHLGMDHAPGTLVRAFVDGTCRVGELVVQAERAEEAMERAEEALRQLELASDD